MADQSGNATSTLTSEELARLRAYLSPAQLAAWPPLEQWQAADFAAARMHLLQLFDVITTYLPRHLARREIRARRELQRLATGEFLQGALAFAAALHFSAFAANWPSRCSTSARTLAINPAVSASLGASRRTCHQTPSRR